MCTKDGNVIVTKTVKLTYLFKIKVNYFVNILVSFY